MDRSIDVHATLCCFADLVEYILVGDAQGKVEEKRQDVDIPMEDAPWMDDDQPTFSITSSIAHCIKATYLPFSSCSITLTHTPLPQPTNIASGRRAMAAM